MFDDATIERIVSLADRSATNPRCLDEALSLLSRALGASGGALFTPALSPADDRHLLATCGDATGYMGEYLRDWAADDPWNRAAIEQRLTMNAGLCRLGREYLQPGDLRRSDFYSDFARRAGTEDIVSLLVTDGSSPAVPRTHLTFARLADEGGFGQEHKRVLLALWPSLRRAIESYWILRKARCFDRIVEQSLDALPQPTWVVREDVSIAFANAAARALMSSGAWATQRGNRLHSFADIDAAQLADHVRAASHGAGCALASGRLSGGRFERAVLRIVPLAPDSPFSTAWLRVRALLSAELPDAAADPAARVARIAKRHRLTPAEQRVLACVAAGLNPKRAALELGVSWTTVRRQLQAVFEKTGCHRQADLVRLVCEN